MPSKHTEMPPPTHTLSEGTGQAVGVGDSTPCLRVFIQRFWGSLSVRALVAVSDWDPVGPTQIELECVRSHNWRRLRESNKARWQGVREAVINPAGHMSSRGAEAGGRRQPTSHSSLRARGVAGCAGAGL